MVALRFLHYGTTAWKSLIYLSHNILKIIFFVTSDLDMSYGKTSDFVSIASFVLIFVIKLTDFDYFATNEKWCQVWVRPVENCLILPVFLAYILFCDKIEWCKFQKSLKYFDLFWPGKNDARFENVPWKNVWFCFVSIVSA